MSPEEKKIHDNDTRKDKSSEVDNELIDNMLPNDSKKEDGNKMYKKKMRDQIQQK